MWTNLETNPWPPANPGETPAAYDHRTRVIRARIQKIYAIIQLVIDENVSIRVREVENKDGYAAWLLIADIFEPIHNGPYVQRLGDEFVAQKYDNVEPIDDYITRVISIGRKLRKAGKPKSDEEIASQILRGLPSRYNGFRDSILNVNPSPGTALVCERLRSQEIRYASQKREKETERELVAAYNTRAQKSNNFQGRRPAIPTPPTMQPPQSYANYQYPGPSPSNTPYRPPYQFGGGPMSMPTYAQQQPWQRQQQPQQQNYQYQQQYQQRPGTPAQGALRNMQPNTRYMLTCEHCKMTGHSKATCWNLNPSIAPKGWLERKFQQSTFRPAQRANATAEEGLQQFYAPSGMEQYQEAGFHPGGHFQPGFPPGQDFFEPPQQTFESYPQGLTASHEDDEEIHGYCTGSEPEPAAYAGGDISLATGHWLMDQGATWHYAKEREKFVNYITLEEPRKVKIGKGWMSAIGKGDYPIKLIFQNQLKIQG
ncbi:hypothetical protein ABW21_db0206604 [Orbilia brochopaga]|nr:hypothetical protein ABW21_db0206604 [Drechslerella brochopaga]